MKNYLLLYRISNAATILLQMSIKIFYKLLEDFFLAVRFSVSEKIQTSFKYIL